MSTDSPLQRDYVHQTLDEISRSLHRITSKEDRGLAETGYEGKWFEQDLFFVDSYPFEGVRNCRLKENEMDILSTIYARFNPGCETQLLNLKMGQRIRVRGRILQIGWNVWLDQCEVL